MDLSKYSKKTIGTTTLTGKSSRGGITIESFHGRLRLRFRVVHKPYTISLGVSESPENWKLAELKAKELEADLIFKQFDPANLNKYRIHNLEIVDTSKQTELSIKQLWNKYLKYKTVFYSRLSIQN